MAWIKVFSIEEATGFLKKEYENAYKRAGRLWHIVSIMSQNPRAMRASMDFYGAIMNGRSPLSRSQREMLAVVVSQINHCVYWIRAHAHDLRAEVANDWGLTDEDEADRVVHLIATNWREAPLGDGDKALCLFAEKLTQIPQKMTKNDVDLLKQQGFDDRAIHDASQVISYFNYINRIADSLGVEVEDFIQPWEKA